MTTLVIGTGRSGTSTIARLLQENLGIDMGGPGLRLASNPEGDYEDVVLARINRARFDGELSPDMWLELVKSVIATREGEWGYKDPVIALLADDYAAAFPDAPVIWAWRNLEDCAISCARWYGWPIERAYLSMSSRASRLAAAFGPRGVPAQTYLPGAIAAPVRGRDGRPMLLVNMNQRRDEDELTDLLDRFLLDNGVQTERRPLVHDDGTE